MNALVVMNGPLAGISGGDVHGLRLVDDWQRRDPGSVTLIAPDIVRPYLPPATLGTLRETPFGGRAGGLVGYAARLLVRMAFTVIKGPAADVDIAASHMIYDVAPCVIRSRLERSRMMVCYVYHLAEEERNAAGLRSRVAILLERWSLALLRRNDALLFVCNDATRSALSERGFDNERFVTTENGSDPWIPLPSVEKSKAPTVVCFGLRAEKGTWDAFEIARRLPDVKLTVIGTGWLAKQVAARIVAEGITNLELAGTVSEEEKWKRLLSAHVFLAPSREEGWGIAIGEALYAGLPVVAYDLPAYLQYRGRISVVPPFDIDALAEALEAALDQAGARGEVEYGLPLWSDILAAEIDRIAEFAGDVGNSPPP